MVLIYLQCYYTQLIFREVLSVVTSLLEIVDLGNGEIVLQRSDDSSDALVTIRFSEESQTYLLGNGLEVARVMIQAGIQAAAAIAQETEENTEEAPVARILH